MRNFRYILRLIKAFTIRFRAIIFAGVILGILFFLISYWVIPLLFGGSTQVVGMTGRYHPDSLPKEILDMVGDGLTYVARDGTVEPALASSWETPDRGKTWTFTLDEDIFWQDEEKVISSDIIYEFSDVEVTRPDEKTISFKMQEPYSPFPLVVSKPTFKKGLLGTGDWKVEKMSLAGSFVREITIKNVGKVDDKGNILNEKIVYKFYPTEDMTRLAFKLGEIDVVAKSFTPLPFATWPTAKVEGEVNENRIVVIFFNNTDKYLSDKSLRQALIYAIDKSVFDGKRATSPIAPTSWAINPQVKRYDYDAERARELINELPGELKDNMQIKLVSAPSLLSTADVIAQMWEEVGVKTLVQVSSVIPTQYQAFLTVLDIPLDPDQYSLWHSTQEATNISHYSNPRIDKLLEDGRTSLKLEERRENYIDFQRFLVEDSPAAFLYHPTTYRIERK